MNIIVGPDKTHANPLEVVLHGRSTRLAVVPYNGTGHHRNPTGTLPALEHLTTDACRGVYDLSRAAASSRQWLLAQPL